MSKPLDQLHRICVQRGDLRMALHTNTTGRPAVLRVHRVIPKVRARQLLAVVQIPAGPSGLRLAELAIIEKLTR